MKEQKHCSESKMIQWIHITRTRSIAFYKKKLFNTKYTLIVNKLNLSNNGWGFTPQTDCEMHLVIILNDGDFGRHAIVI